MERNERTMIERRAVNRRLWSCEGMKSFASYGLLAVTIACVVTAASAASATATGTTSRSVSVTSSDASLSGSVTQSDSLRTLSDTATPTSNTPQPVFTATNTWSGQPSSTASHSEGTLAASSSGTRTSITRVQPETISHEATATRATATASASVSASRVSSTRSPSSTYPTRIVSTSASHDTPSSSWTSTDSPTVSERIRVYLGQCVPDVYVGPHAVKEWLPAHALVGAVPSSSGFVPYYQVSAFDFRAYGIRISVSVRNPDRNATANAALDGAPTFVNEVLQEPSSAYTLSVKDAMYERMVGPADTVSHALLFLEGNSSEGHGIMDLLAKRKAAVVATANANNSLDVAMIGFQAYRIANSEWLVLNFFDNTTIPNGCVGAMTQVVVKVEAFSYHAIKQGTDGLCFAVLLAGLLASVAGTPLMLTQHAGAVALLALLHFAQEDGDPLPLSINVFQASIGDSKYRFVVGVLVVQTSVLFVLAAVHYVVAVWIFPLVRDMNVRSSQATLRHPALTVSVVLHVAPGMWFAFGRNLGHQTAAHYVLNFLSFSVLAYLTWIAFRGLVSSSMSVRYLPHKNAYGQLIDHGFHDELLNAMHTGGGNMVLHQQDEDGAPVLVESASSATLVSFVAQEEAFLDLSRHRPHAYLILREAMDRQTPSWLRRLLLWLDEEHGEWRSIDPQGTFLKSRGYAVQSYTKNGRLWMGLEQIDVFMVALLTLVDNYTPQLASIQFGITLAVKVSMFLAAIRLQPARRTYAGVLLLALYLFEVIAALALLISGLHTRLIPLAQVVHAVACFLCACVLVLEVLGAVLIGAVVAYFMMRRRKAFLASSRGKDPLTAFTSPCTTAYDVPLMEGVGLIDGELEGSEAGLAARRREEAIRSADQRYAAYWKAEQALSGGTTVPLQPDNAADRDGERPSASSTALPSPTPPSGKSTRKMALQRQRWEGEVFDRDIAELVGVASPRKAQEQEQQAEAAVNLVDLLLIEQRNEEDVEAPTGTMWW